MNTKKKGRTPIYENAFKVAVAREYLTGNCSYSFLAKKYGLSGPKPVNGFVRWYKKHYGDDVSQEVKYKEEEAITGDSGEKQLIKQLKAANLKIAGLEMLIESTQKELGIDIVKKPGTKQ